jgi:hypothetical protein
MSIEQQLRLASDTLMAALEQMHELEEEKRREPAGSERFLELAREIDDLALQILRHTERQESIAETLDDRREAGGGVSRPIETIPPKPRPLSDILAEWRDAERQLAAADLGSPEATDAAGRIRELREEYRNSFPGGFPEQSGIRTNGPGAR